MNLKMNLNLGQMLKGATRLAYKFRGPLIVITVIGLIGYAAYLMTGIVSLTPNQAYLTDQRAKLDKTKVSFDKSTINTINGLQQVNPQTDITNLGKSNPFAP